MYVSLPGRGTAGFGLFRMVLQSTQTIFNLYLECFKSFTSYLHFLLIKQITKQLQPAFGLNVLILSGYRGYLVFCQNAPFRRLAKKVHLTDPSNISPSRMSETNKRANCIFCCSTFWFHIFPGNFKLGQIEFVLLEMINNRFKIDSINDNFKIRG